MALSAELGANIQAALSGAVLGHKYRVGELTLEAAAERINNVLKYLRDDPSCEFKILVDICGVDWPQREKRFDVVYHLLSLKQNMRIRVKVQVAEDGSVPSAIAIYPAANWF